MKESKADETLAMGYNKYLLYIYIINNITSTCEYSAQSARPAMVKVQDEFHSGSTGPLVSRL
jgi:hypothetical protein